MKILFVILALWLAAPVQAHDLWLARQDGELRLHYGHAHSAHQGAQLIAYEPDWIQRTLCLDAAGDEIDLAPHATSPLRMPGQCAVAFVLTSSGYWTKTPYGTKNLPRAEARMPIKSWLSYESVKRIDQWNPTLARPLTEELEITPLNDPLSLDTGRKLRLQITFRGEPLEGVVVAYDGKPRGQTGADGRINLRIRHRGFQIIQASVKRPDATDKADEVIYATSLNFELSEE
jgi:nickel transport protein